MNKAFGKVHDGRIKGRDRAYALDWRKRMSDNVAYALVVYTALHIFATVGAMKETGMKSMALLALVVLVVAIIPACRSFERRWRDLSDESASDLALAPAFRRDQVGLWIMAIGLPFALTAIFKAASAFL
ncbi:MAG: hypothetical protein B7X57_10710 [Erythrobacter sp. 34-65-8]|nr:MAG: hypothetical protein B7X57_10710 [Erythrobacter sp. 34-65-8]